MTDKNKTNILVILCSANKLSDSSPLNHIYEVFSDEFNILVANPIGGLVQFSGPNSPVLPAEDSPIKSVPFDLVDPQKFQALIIPSIYGAMVDLPNNDRLGYIICEMHKHHRIISCIGYGVSGLLSAKNSATNWIFDGFSMTAPTLYEEITEKPYDCNDPHFYLETNIRSNGGEYSCSKQNELGATHVVVDSNLITAQNKDSSLLALQITKLMIA